MYKKSEEKVRLIFVYQVGSFWPSWDSLYTACMTDDRFEVKLLWIDDSVGDKAQMEYAEDFLVEKQVPYEPFSYERVMQYHPTYMIYQTPYDKGHRVDSTWTARYRREGIRIVYIPYGIEISDTAESRYKHFSLPVVLNAYSVFVLSESMKKEYEKYCINAKAVKALGLPRFDALRRENPLSDVLKERIAGRKVILWKAHFPKIFVENGIKKQATPDLDEYIKFVDYIKKRQDIFCIFMPHPKFADATIDLDLLPRAQQILEEMNALSNVYIDRSDDYRNSLTNADAIIVDRSAVMIEVGALGVPVLYMYNKTYNEPMTEPIQKLLDNYYQGTTEQEMEGFCDMIRAGEDEKREFRQNAFRECVPYYDGKCAERILERLWLDAQYDEPIGMVCELPPNARIAVAGTGHISNYCMKILEQQAEKSIEVVCFADNNKQKQGLMFHDRPIIAMEELPETGCEYIVIASDKYYRDLYLQLLKIGYTSDRILNYDHFIILTKYEKQG